MVQITLKIVKLAILKASLSCALEFRVGATVFKLMYHVKEGASSRS